MQACNLLFSELTSIVARMENKGLYRSAIKLGILNFPRKLVHIALQKSLLQQPI